MKELQIIIDGILVLLRNNHYSEETIGTYLREWKHLKDFLEETYNSTLFCMERGMKYLEVKYHIVSNYNQGVLSQRKVQLLRMIHMLEDYQLSGTLTRRYYASKNPIVLTDFYQKVHDAYDVYLENDNLSKCTRDHYLKTTIVFLDFLHQKGIDKIEEINFSVCSDFIKTFSGYSFKTVEMNVCGLRRFLHYLNENKMIKDDIASKINMPCISKNAHIPSVWSIEELKKLLAAIDRSSPIGKRDYAMIVLACVLGIRSGDIKRLRFSNFDWNNHKLTFVQHKTHNTIVLPLPASVGWAIIDYIKNGRPKVRDNDIVFVKHMPPFDSFSDSNHLDGIIYGYMRKAGIKLTKNRHCGFHSMRHTVGSMLLEEETPVNIIADILGHVDTSTTAIYLKEDINKLRDCILDEEEWDYEIKYSI